MSILVLLCVWLFDSFLTKCQSQGQEYIPIMMAMDDHYARPTVVALTSMFENANRSVLFQVFILIPSSLKSVNKVRINSLEGKYENCEINFIDMGEKYVNAPKFWGSTASAYYRLDIPGLFPQVKKCLYFDGDIIVRHDVSEIYNVNMDDYYIAGVFEGHLYSTSIYIKKEVEEKSRILEIPDFEQYICSGVVVMNLEKMRTEKLGEKYVVFLEKKGKQIKEKTFLYYDQEVINSVCYGKILILPHEYGLLINIREWYPEDEFEKKNPVIVHFAGFPKPWTHNKHNNDWSPHNLKTTKFHREFWDYAKKAGLYPKEKKKICRHIGISKREQISGKRKKK